jgi:hypothetical protein
MLISYYYPLISRQLLTSARCSAGYQIATNSAYGVSGQGYREVLQGIVVLMLEWPAKSPRSSEGAPGSKEAGTYARKGRSAYSTVPFPC